MQVIHLHHPYDKTKIPKQDVVLVLGFFDGVHLGHQAVIKAGRKLADEKQLPLAVMTFNQKPSLIFKKAQAKDYWYLTTLRQRIQHMAELKVDLLYIVDFTSAFASLEPQKFVDLYLVGLHAKAVVAGFDYTYGRPGATSMAQLPDYAQGRFEVITVDCETADAKKISSSRIRHLLDKGEVAAANKLLGYTYETEGIVVHGDARGRQLGFPTANVRTDPEDYLPLGGVYAVQMLVQGKWQPGMAQIGYNVTFKTSHRMTIEVYLLDFKQEIYGEPVRVRWYEYFRGEVKFSGPAELVRQLKHDEARAKQYFAALN